MRRQIVIRYSLTDSEQADSFQAKWSGRLNVTFDGDNTARHATAQATESDAFNSSGDEAKPQVSVLLIGIHTAEDTAVRAALDGALARGESVIGVRLASDV